MITEAGTLNSNMFFLREHRHIIFFEMIEENQLTFAILRYYRLNGNKHNKIAKIQIESREIFEGMS